jgi:hypothetical protein
MAFQKRVKADRVRNSFQGLAILFDSADIIIPTLQVGQDPAAECQPHSVIFPPTFP